MKNPLGFEPHRRERRLRECVQPIEAERFLEQQRAIRERLAAEIKARFADRRAVGME